jgi:glutamyl-tRNA synthetase
MQKIITRFAPSPTGLLHVGNIRTAIANWLFARKHNGKFILRIDDTDVARSKKEFETAIKEDLFWLGLKWDETLNQKDRLARYEKTKKQLAASGELYPCYETQEELEIKRKIQLSQDKPPIYDRYSLNLTKEQIAKFEAEGRTPHFRFKLANKRIAWKDLVRGEVKFEAGIASDPILIREDGSWTYMLCSVIDDIDLGITHIIRGDDHVNNTAIHIQLFEALGAKPPIFGHLPRVTSKISELSKRKGGFDVKTLREEKELEAMTLNNLLATIGTSGEPSGFVHMQDLIKLFDIKKFHKSPTTYDEKDLIRINHKIISQYSFDEVKSRLTQMNITIDENFWLAVRNNLSKLSEIKIWYDICINNITPQIPIEDKKFLMESAKLLPTDHEWNEETWEKWIGLIKAQTDRKGKNIFMPLRMALTGLDHGPELKYLLPLIGQEKTLKRLNA